MFAVGCQGAVHRGLVLWHTRLPADYGPYFEHPVGWYYELDDRFIAQDAAWILPGGWAAGVPGQRLVVRVGIERHDRRRSGAARPEQTAAHGPGRLRRSLRPSERRESGALGVTAIIAGTPFAHVQGADFRMDVWCSTDGTASRSTGT